MSVEVINNNIIASKQYYVVIIILLHNHSIKTITHNINTITHNNYYNRNEFINQSINNKIKNSYMLINDDLMIKSSPTSSRPCHKVG